MVMAYMKLETRIRIDGSTSEVLSASFRQVISLSLLVIPNDMSPIAFCQFKGIQPGLGGVPLISLLLAQDLCVVELAGLA